MSQETCLLWCTGTGFQATSNWLYDREDLLNLQSIYILFVNGRFFLMEKQSEKEHLWQGFDFVYRS